VELRTVTIPAQSKTSTKINVYFLGDIHEGAANHQKRAFADAVKMIEADGDYWIGMGDYVDCINHLDPRFNPREIGEEYQVRDLDDLPRQQANKLIKALEPIKAKCLGLIYGNHEDSYRKHNTFDVVAYMCDHLEVANLRHKAWISIVTEYTSNGKPITMPIKIVVCHGAGGGGMREGYPVNKTYDTFRWDMADIHIMGHLHRMSTDRAIYNRAEYDTIRQDKVWFGCNGCFLSKSEIGSDGYFEQRAGKESDIGMLKLSMDVSCVLKAKCDLRLEKIYI